MPDLPIRNSLVNQTADILRQGIAQGTWFEWLPSERTLCKRYQVSRNTLRSALKRLERDKQIRPLHGTGHQIIVKPTAEIWARSSRDAALLTPEGLERLRPTQLIMIDELRVMLSEFGCRLHVYSGAQYFRTSPNLALKKLLQQNPHGCWILLKSTAPVQKWFNDNFRRCIVFGSVHAGLDLPSRDLDHRAICRHATGALLGLGHDRIALVISKFTMAGDLESKAGLLEAVAQSSRAGAEAIICAHDGTVTGIKNELQRLMKRRNRPTALLVANAYHYLTVTTQLNQIGLRIPEDVSIISRDDDSFLSYLVPTPAHYFASPTAFARLLMRAVLEILETGQVQPKEIRLMSDYIRGESVRACP